MEDIMPILDIAFLALVCVAFGAFVVTLGATAWYCRDGALRRAPALARAPRQVGRT
jgi:hypothetical protein